MSNLVFDIVDKAVRKAMADIDQETRKLLIEHGYERYIEKAIHGKTERIRKINQNKIKNLVMVEWHDPVFDYGNYSCTQKYDIKWIGK